MKGLSVHPISLTTWGGRREWKAFPSSQFPLTTGGGRCESKTFPSTPFLLTTGVGRREWKAFRLPACFSSQRCRKT
ncbi:hypothetical protein AVEN_25950-1 [Araneus ventricosus]|uniref:Uncharacterized protein n=1 Tax=Araneus ventricosus TaxID=182803 RepID=A0A4Y2K836_ARAVE|nr:hypothetical protein AVEN_25950-1 [Araneus ventricosus]